MGARLNSRVKIRSKLTGGEGRTLVTITHERVTDRAALASSKLGTDTNDENVPMMNRTRAKQTAEKAVGLDNAESRPHHSEMI